MSDYRNILDYQRSTGVPARATSTVRAPGSKTAAGYTSCHAADNTRCDAVDFAGPSAGVDTDDLGRIFWCFEPVFHLMHELIYAGPQTTFNIKNGERVAKYAEDGHHDHVHAALLTSVTLPLPVNLPPAPNMEDDMPTVVAQDAVMNPGKPGHGYVLDAQGGIHPVGGAPAVTGGPYWKLETGMGPARRLIVTDWAKPAGYVLDALGSLHPFGGAPKVSGPYWANGFVPPAAKA